MQVRDAGVSLFKRPVGAGLFKEWQRLPHRPPAVWFRAHAYYGLATAGEWEESSRAAGAPSVMLEKCVHQLGMIPIPPVRRPPCDGHE